MTAAEIVAEARRLSPLGTWVCLTGGEPTLQADAALVAALREAGFKVALETTGTQALEGWWPDWCCVSPKSAEHTLRILDGQRTEITLPDGESVRVPGEGRIDELKYVRHEGQAIPRPTLTAWHYLISPAFQPDGTVARATLQWCVDLVKVNPQWRLSLQLHKWLRIR
jgi:organic radical activating enzyme